MLIELLTIGPWFLHYALSLVEYWQLSRIDKVGDWLACTEIDLLV